MIRVREVVMRKIVVVVGRTHYSLVGMTPYGHASDNLIR